MVEAKDKQVLKSSQYIAALTVGELQQDIIDAITDKGYSYKLSSEFSNHYTYHFQKVEGV